MSITWQELTVWNSLVVISIEHSSGTVYCPIGIKPVCFEEDILPKAWPEEMTECSQVICNGSLHFNYSQILLVQKTSLTLERKLHSITLHEMPCITNVKVIYYHNFRTNYPKFNTCDPLNSTKVFHTEC